MNWLLVALFLGMFAGYVYGAYRIRAHAMKSLALRLGFRYSKGLPFRWPGSANPRLPDGFTMKGTPTNLIRRSWNVVEGQINGVRVMIFDSELGQRKGRGWYSTFIAIHIGDDLFAIREKPEKTAKGKDWTVLYRYRFWQIGWTLSISRIEEHLYSLQNTLNA